MPDNPGMSRRKLIGLGAATLAGAALPDALFNLSSAAAAAAGPTEGIGYFARFGVTEKMLRDGLGAALSRGADYADLFFQHRVANGLGLEDGEVNRASTSRRARRRRPRRQGRPDRLRLHRGPHPRGARPGREDGRRDRRRPGEARPEGAGARRRPSRPLPGEDPLGGRAAAAEAAAPLRPQREGPRGRQADPEGQRQLRRRGGRDPDRRLERPDRRGPPADDAPRTSPASPSRTGRRRRTATTSPAAPTSASTRPRGSTAWSGKPSPGRSSSSTPSRRRPARCRSSSAPARRGSSCTRRSATAWRPTSTARGSPSSPTGSASRSRTSSSTSSTRGRCPPRAARSTSTTRATRSARRCSSRTAS